MYYPLDWRPDGATIGESFLQYAHVFRDAIEILFHYFEENKPIHDYALAPVLTLIRHYIELQLKGLILYRETDGSAIKKKKIATHDIIELYKKVREISDKFGLVPDRTAEAFIRFIGELDRKGQIFRYPYTKEGYWIFDENLDKETIRKILMSPQNLRELFSKVSDDLEGLETYLEFYYWFEL